MRKQGVGFVGLELLESREMLASSADIVFIVDESRSSLTSSDRDWLIAAVTHLDQNLLIESIDRRDGMVAIGNEDTDPIIGERFAHSQTFAGGEIFTTNPLQVINVVNTKLKSLGGHEDGWDGIEHVIA